MKITFISILLCSLSSILFLSPSFECADLTGYLNGTYTIIIDANYDDAKLNGPQLITKYGYPCEIHHVTTPDGYILEMHRIPYGKNSPQSPNRPVAFIQHGLLSSSADWVANAITGNVLPFILADAGYDVWLGNFRGNTYSTNHTTFDPSENSGPYWDFSVHEYGLYDITSSMDYALNTAGQTDLIYIGQSMGTTAFFVGMSLRPDFNQKIKLAIQLAPAVYMTHMKNPIFRVLAPLLANGLSQELLLALGPGKYAPNNAIVNQIKMAACPTVITADLICDTQFFLMYGFDYSQMNNSQLPVYINNTETASTKAVIHNAQAVNVKRFCQYDYGLLGNIAKYGSAIPPLYDLSKVTAPVVMYYGNGDWLATATDAKYLMNSGQVPNMKFNKAVPWDQFNHVDFIIAKDVKPLLYDDVLSVMKE